MKKIDSYILTEIAGPFFGGIVFFSFVFLMSQLLRLAEFLIGHEVPLLVLGKMIFFMIISFSHLVLPVAFLIALLIGFGRLSTDSEMVAFKAGGTSLLRLSIPVFGFSFVVGALVFMLNLSWAPWAERTFYELLTKAGNTKVVKGLQEGAFTSGFFDLVIFTEKVNKKTSELEKVFLFDERNSAEPVVVVAKKGQLLPIKKNSDFGASMILQLKNGSLHRSHADDAQHDKVEFHHYNLYLTIAEGISGFALKTSMMTQGELTDKMNKEDPKSADYREMRTEIWRRLSTGFTPFVFVFLGIGFGTFQLRSVKSGATIITLLVVIIYWTLMIFCFGLSQDGILPPYISMFLPFLVLLIPGLFVFRRAMW